VTHAVRGRLVQQGRCLRGYGNVQSAARVLT
jgi:hypothetical protein